MAAARLQGLYVRLRGWMRQHLTIHRWRDHDGRSRGEMDRSQQIRRESMSELSDTVRAGWSDQQEVRSVSQIDMARLPTLALLPNIGGDWITRKCLQGTWLNKAAGTRRHNRKHIRTCLAQATGDVRRLKCSDRSSNSK